MMNLLNYADIERMIKMEYKSLHFSYELCKLHIILSTKYKHGKNKVIHTRFGLKSQINASYPHYPQSYPHFLVYIIFQKKCG